MNCCRVCTFAFGNARERLLERAPGSRPVSPPSIVTNDEQVLRLRVVARRSVALEIVTAPNGEPPVGGSKMPLTVNVRVLPVRT